MIANPPGYIPVVGQGLVAKIVQAGTEGGKEWLKSVKLHKYWPTFSQWSYEEFMSLTEENIDSRLSDIGGKMTIGAKGRLVSRMKDLRNREHVLSVIALGSVSGILNLGSALDYLQRTVRTPLPSTHISNVSCTLIIAAVTVQCFLTSLQKEKGTHDEQLVQKMNEILREVIRRPALRRALAVVENELANRTSIKKHCSALADEDRDWYRPSADSEGIWPQEEKSVMFTVYPRSLVQEYQAKFPQIGKPF